jgi:cytochrome c oxidase cbb3-type subunit 1
VVQAIIGWWFANNLLFVWLGLAGMGIALYFLPKLAEKPLASSGEALFAFLTLIFFGAWCGIPRSAPVPAWLPTLSTYAALLALVPVVALAILAWKTVRGTPFRLTGGPFCFIKFGTLSFVASALLYLGEFCPRGSQVLDFTWYGFAVTQWQLLGFAGMILCGAIYYILPRIMDRELPFPGLARFSFFAFALGILFYVIPLLIGGVEQGMKLRDASVPFMDVSAATLLFFRISSSGQLLILLGALCLLLNLGSMTLHWKLGLLKTVIAAVKAPLPTEEVKS